MAPPVKLSPGNQVFALAAPHVWKGLPNDVISADSLLTFRRLLRRFLFQGFYFKNPIRTVFVVS